MMDILNALKKLVPFNKTADKVSHFQAHGFECVEAVRDWKDPEYVVEGYILDNGLCMMFGPSGKGKSFVALDIGLSVAAGIDWHDKKVKGGPVIYVSGEGRSGLKGRLKAWFLTRKVKDEDSLFFINSGPVNLSDEKDVKGFIGRVGSAFAKQPVRLIIFDTLANCTLGADENSSRDVNLIVQNCRLVQNETKAAVLLVHHTGHSNEERARGSSSLKGAMDTEMGVNSNGAKNGLAIKITKQKDGEPEKPFHMRRIPVYGTKSCVLEPDVHMAANDNGKVKPPGDNQRIILDILKENEPAGVERDVLRQEFSERYKKTTGKLDSSIFSRTLNSLKERVVEDQGVFWRAYVSEEDVA